LRLTGNQGQVSGIGKAINISTSGNQIYVKNCWIGTMGYGIYGNPTSDSNYIGNTMEYVHTPISLTGTGSGYFNISDNNFYNCGPASLGSAEQRASFIFDASTSINFSNNRITVDAAMSPQSSGIITISNSSNFEMNNNIFYGNTYRGKLLVATSLTNANITGNIFSSMYKGYVLLTTCSNIKLTENTLPALVDTGNVSVNIIDVTGSSDILIKDNKIGKSGLYTIKVYGSSSYIKIDGNILDGGSGISSAYNVIYCTASSFVSILNNVFKNITISNYDVTADTTPNTIISNNIFCKGYSIDPGSAPTLISDNAGLGARLYVNAAPIYGSWLVGDKVYFSAPTAGGFIGAVCVTAGSPGTWKTFGAISS
jgi:hypothetical protein